MRWDGWAEGIFWMQRPVERVCRTLPQEMLLGTHGQGWVLSQVIEQMGSQPNLCAPTSFKLYLQID